MKNMFIKIIIVKGCNNNLIETEYSMQIIEDTAYVSVLVSPQTDILKINNQCLNSIH